uniref:Uncharacterized protein n=1 Tax=Panagrolaimus sp. JU765 TaxID=591449 RepID=A0AC34RMW5_9BILA
MRICWNTRDIVAVSHYIRHNEGLEMREYMVDQVVEELKAIMVKAQHEWTLIYEKQGNNIEVKTLYKKKKANTTTEK